MVNCPTSHDAEIIPFHVDGDVSRFGAPTHHHGTGYDCRRDEVLSFCSQQKHLHIACEVKNLAKRSML
jgi:hypothetical protein